MSPSITALTRQNARAAHRANSTLANRGCKGKTAGRIGSSMLGLARKAFSSCTEVSYYVVVGNCWSFGLAVPADRSDAPKSFVY